MRRSFRPLVRSAWVLACVLALVSAIASCAAKRGADEPLLSGTLEESLVEATAIVESVDHGKRTVTIRRPDGKTLTLPVDAQVKNLAQVDPGDEVFVSYYESIAFDVMAPGASATPGITASSEVGTAKEGAPPAASETRMVTVTSTIDSIDRATPAVTLRGTEGETRTIKIRDRQTLDDIEVGDLVEIHYTQALAISVRATH